MKMNNGDIMVDISVGDINLALDTHNIVGIGVGVLLTMRVQQSINTDRNRHK